MRPEPTPTLSPARWAMTALLLAGLGSGCRGEPESVSAKGRVMAKTGAVWGRDLAQGLGLQEWELCSELGSYDCISEAHRITLGGVEPTTLGIDDPLPNASASAPLATDRVAISACAERYSRDKQGSPVLFGPVLEKDSRRHREQVSTSLVQRLLGREPTDDELSALVDLHDELEGVSTDLTRDWAVGACVMVATSTEALFY